MRAWTEQLQRIAFALGAVAFVLACLLGVAESFRSDRRLPAANVLADGPAEHIETLLRNRQFAQAIRDLAQYESMSNDRLPHERMRDVLSQLDPEARREVADILREYPRYRQGHFLLAYAFLLADEYEGAQREFEEVLRTQPKHAEAHNGLGLALAYQGHGEEAAAEFWQALRLRPDLEEPRYNLRHIEPLLERSPSRPRSPSAQRHPTLAPEAVATATRRWCRTFRATGSASRALDRPRRPRLHGRR